LEPLFAELAEFFEQFVVELVEFLAVELAEFLDVDKQVSEQVSDRKSVV
jgi:hypothetical protein